MKVDRGTFLKMMAASPLLGIVGAGAATAAPTGAAAQSGLDLQGASEALRLADAWLTTDVAYNAIPALSIGVVSGEALLWAKGYGHVDPARTIPASPTTLFGIGSVSKLFTTIAVMQEVAAGRLDLNAPLERALPWARPSRGVTLERLLSHRAGLDRDVGPVWSAPDFRAPTEAELRSAYRERPRLYEAGAQHHYSNVGMALAGLAVERASGLSFADYVRGRIAAPLGMGDTAVGLPMALRDTRLPRGYSAFDLQRRREELPPFDSKAYAPAGGVTSCVVDLAKFAAWIFQRRRAGDPAMADMLQARGAPTPFLRTYGLGFHLRDLAGETLVGHFGEIPGYRAEFWLHLPSETALIVLRNASGGAFTYADAVFGLLGRRRGPQFPNRHTPLPPEALEAYAGRYSEAPWGAEGVAAPWAGGLAYVSLPTVNPGSEVALFRPVGPDLFRRVRPDGVDAEAIRFERGADGAVTGFTQDDSTRRRLGGI